jgi:hypothetical protein
LYSSSVIIRATKSRGLRWDMWHVWKKREMHTVLDGKPEKKETTWMTQL